MYKKMRYLVPLMQAKKRYGDKRAVAAPYNLNFIQNKCGFVEWYLIKRRYWLICVRAMRGDAGAKAKKSPTGQGGAQGMVSLNSG
ncbi:hypothetical protein N4G40_12605 [Pantoea eucrina]|uniref:Uncharacterized protein n=1 Tax=Pantoea eucrina TaxID=472693 RepID=A0ABU5LGN4_9GAMM|nr:hypothetical protein [Pantoea eucrina]MDZ7279105.1 hypothetical protein [Pantoea eucrina]